MEKVRRLTVGKQKRSQARKSKIILGVIIEIAIMATEILCCLLPMPWRLAVPIIIGARAIINKAIRYVRTPQASPVVYCNGVSAPHNERKRTESKGYGKAKERTDKTPAGKRG